MTQHCGKQACLIIVTSCTNNHGVGRAGPQEVVLNMLVRHAETIRNRLRKTSAADVGCGEDLRNIVREISVLLCDTWSTFLARNNKFHC